MKITQYFRTSLFRKVFSVSSIISIALIYFLGSNLYNRISDGIIDEKISAAISEGEAAIQYADYRFLIGSLNKNPITKQLSMKLLSLQMSVQKPRAERLHFLVALAKGLLAFPQDLLQTSLSHLQFQMS